MVSAKRDVSPDHGYNSSTSDSSKREGERVTRKEGCEARTGMKSNDKPVRKPSSPTFQPLEGERVATKLGPRWGELRLGHAADRECRVVGRARSSSAALRPKGVAVCLRSDTTIKPSPLFLEEKDALTNPLSVIFPPFDHHPLRSFHRLLRKGARYATIECDGHESDRESDAVTRRLGIVTVSQPYFSR